jgi:hypothetical protein
VSLPRSSGKIVDFFREFTLHVDSLGYVCSFAVFDFKRHGNPLYGANPGDSSDQHMASKGGKMESSFLSFKAANPDWDPGMEGSAYLANVMSRHRNFSGGGYSSSLGPPGNAESVMMASEWSSDGRHPSGTGPTGLGQDIFRLLDAVYQSNRTVI